MDILAAIMIGLGASIAVLVWHALLRSAPPGPRAGATPAAGFDNTQILLKQGRVVDTTDAARALLECTKDEGLTWRDLTDALEPLFGSLPAEAPPDPLSQPALSDSETVLSIVPEGIMHRITVNGPPVGAGERLRVRAAENELTRLRHAMTHAPCPVWQTDSARNVTWYNTAYEDLCAEVQTEPEAPSPFNILPVDRQETHIERTSIGNRESGAQHWYEVHSHHAPEGWLHFALNIDPVIHSEISQRNFLQTLTRIFAHLPIGLAVFDKDRRLVLFNPSLIDLTHLPAEFLSGRPNLMSFFDLMREQRMMPEPKNYQNWRDKLTEVIAAASSDLYVETWNLPSGLTYKITGRPHPDGGIALLFEDISAEVSLTRRFRQEIEVTLAVLDRVDEGVAVFSHMGVLSFCNEAYRKIWNSDPDGTVGDLGIAEATREWQASCQPSPAWAEVRDFVLTTPDRAPWEAELRRLDGSPLTVRIEPIAGGSTLIRFLPRTLHPQMRELTSVEL